MKIKLMPLLLVALLAMVGCSSNDGQQRHAELQPFAASVTAKVHWKTQVGLGSEEHYTSLQPAYDNGFVYAADRYGLLVAYELKTGKRAWQRDLGSKKRWFAHHPRGESARLSAGPVIVDDRLYLASENGFVYALDKTTGDTIWLAEVQGEVMTAPTVAEGFIVLHLSNGQIVALKETDGSQQWTFEEDTSLLSLRSASRPVITSGGVVVGTATGKLLVLLLENGRLAWEERIAAPKGSSDLERMTDVDGSPLIVGDTVYISAYNGETVALELRTGDVLWKRDHASMRGPNFIRNRLMLVSQESHIIAMDRFSGTELWRNSDLYFRSVTDVVEHDGYLAVADRFGYVHWLNSQTGEFVGRIQLAKNDAIRTAPIRAEQYLAVQSAAGRLYVLELPK